MDPCLATPLQLNVLNRLDQQQTHLPEMQLSELSNIQKQPVIPHINLQIVAFFRLKFIRLALKFTETSTNPS
jgi:hypothetical protein